MPQLHILAQCDSTNRRLREALDENPDAWQSGDAIMSLHQTEGRGQRGNHWESEAGQNLLISLLIRPIAIQPTEAFQLTRLVSLAVKDLLEAYGVEARIKWPNDIYVGDRKIAGILMESRFQGNRLQDCLCGIGLNVGQKRFLSDAPNPVSMAQLREEAGGRGPALPQPAELAAGLQARLLSLLAAYDRPDTSFEALETAYHKALYRGEGYHPFRDAEGEFSACIEGVSPNGTLRLKREDSRCHEYEFKEVAFLVKMP